jgi:ATP-dependent Clp protease ATP-binding subunit ClpB
VETEVGRALLRGSIAEGGVVTVTASGGELVVDYSTMELEGAGTP